MSTSKKTIDFTSKNVKAFTGWLKRFSTIGNMLLLEIDQSKSYFIAKTYNDERSVVKKGSIKFDEAGLVTKPSTDSKRIKVGIFNIARLIKIMEQFNDKQFTFTIEFQEITNNNELEYAAEKIILKNNTLKMSVDCTSLNIFKYITDDLFTNTIASMPIKENFDLLNDDIAQITILNVLDNEHKFMKFEVANSRIFVTGKTYEFDIAKSKNTNKLDIGIFKSQFISLDDEAYDVELGEEKLVFRSKDSETVTVISKAEDNE